MSTTFELSEIKDYWCVVAIDQDDLCYIIKSSKDAIADDMFPEGHCLDDNCIDCALISDKPMGIYRLLLEPTYDGEGADRYIDGGAVTEVTLLYTLSE
jgi:hypothetical protein